MDPDELRERLDRARVYLVCGGRPGLVDFLEDALGAGVDVLQLREKELEAAPILEIAEVFRDRCDAHGVPFIVNDRADLALAAAADGVHLGQEDLPVAHARRILGRHAIVGRSTHDADQFRRALSEDVDYVVAGPVHETPTKPGRPAAGIDLIRVAAGEATKPWFAIGGIDAATIGEVRAAGASRVVVVRAITDAPDPAAAVKALRASLE
ncbi:MAG: thiamine phosphate synthase [Actinobacteria bacterium]|nr:MAG: thiamine phosphate synthase [Actinomycetota bacterium]